MRGWVMGFRVQDLNVKFAQSSGVRVQNSGVGVQDLRCGVQGRPFTWGLKCRVWGLGATLKLGVWVEVSVVGVRVWGLVLRV